MHWKWTGVSFVIIQFPLRIVIFRFLAKWQRSRRHPDAADPVTLKGCLPIGRFTPAVRAAAPPGHHPARLLQLKEAKRS